MDSKKSNYNKLKKLSLSEGMSLFGVANIDSIRESILLEKNVLDVFKYAISIGFRLSESVLMTIKDAPNHIYYFHYQRINLLLDQTTLKLSSLIQKKGYQAFPVPASQVTDWQNQLGVLSHRDIALHAGLGWYGKNNLLVNPEYGSQVRYASVLTNLPLNTDKPVKGSCSSCSLCVRLCPAKAIKTDGFDRNACHTKLKEFMKTERIGQMICGVCIKACSKGGKQ